LRVTVPNPFDSDTFWYTVHPMPVASDDGLFNHAGEYVLCNGCQSDPIIGRAPRSHGHIVIEGSNGGVRCEPLTDDSLQRVARECLYPPARRAAIQICHAAGGNVRLVLDCSVGASTFQLLLFITQIAADALGRDGAGALDSLIARHMLFDVDDDDS
jgi:hypothetical protein